TEFGKIVTSCLSWKQLNEVIDQHAGRIFSYDNWEVLLYEEPKQLLRSFANVSYALDSHPILKACTREYTSRRLPNLTADSETAKSLGTL
ncbi:hypothetical protein LI170_16265, partial [Desulfovibrio desulfuricans]